jgi:hypothetical protein
MNQLRSLLGRVLTIALLTSSHNLFAADSWSALGNGVHTLITGDDTTAGSVESIALGGAELYAGGSFDRSGAGAFLSGLHQHVETRSGGIRKHRPVHQKPGYL